MKFVFTPISVITGLLAGLFDHGTRRTFAGATGSWPGEEGASVRLTRSTKNKDA